MSNTFILYNLDMSNKFSNEELQEYIKTLTHSEKCSRKMEDKRKVGEIHIYDTVYYLYSCKECGGIYTEKFRDPFGLMRNKERV